MSYALGIYLLSLFLAFLTPKVDPALQQSMDDDGKSIVSTCPVIIVAFFTSFKFLLINKTIFMHLKVFLCVIVLVAADL